MGRQWQKLETVILIIMTVSLFFVGQSSRDLWTPDEPRVAEIGREMAESGNFVVPMLNRKPFLEQPPLFYASLATVFKIAGKATDGLSRIPPAVYGLFGVFATYLMASFLFGKRVGLISAFILATSFEYFRVSHWVIVDSALACFVYFGIWAFIKAYFGERKKRFQYYFLFYVFLTLAFFVKGFVGIVVPGVAVITFLFFDRNLKEIKKMHLPIGIAVFIISVGTWTFALYKQGGSEYLKTFFIDNNLMRFLPGGTSGHHHPFYYYFKEFPFGYAPWIILLVPAFFYVFSKNPSHERRGLLFFKCYFISGFILFSLAATKRILYLIPIFPSASIIIATYLDHLFESRILNKRDKVFHWAFGLLFILISALIGPVTLEIANKYGIKVARIDTLILFCTSITLTLLTLFSLLLLKRKGIKRFFFLGSVTIFLFLLFLLLWVSPYVNEHKSFKPFVKEVMKEIDRKEPLYTYKPDETIRGFFPFYTGIYLNEIREKDDLSLLATKNEVHIVVRDKDRRLAAELKEEGFTEVISMERGRMTLSLFRKR